MIGAQTSHWAGEEPSEIAGQENPTLPMTVGEEYTVTWHNRDGNYHKLLIRDADNDVLARSAGNNEAGGTESVTFVATGEMDNYQCEPHYSMNGVIDTRRTSSATSTEPSSPTETRTSTDTGSPTSTGSPATNGPDATTGTASESASGPQTQPSRATGTPTESGDGGRTVDGSQTETSTNEEDSEDQSVFGTGSALAGVGVIAYLRHRFRSADD